GTQALKIAEETGIGPFSLQNIYLFYRTSAAVYTAEGMGFSLSAFPLQLAGHYTDPDEIFFFPLTYGRADSSTFELSVPIPLLGAYISKGTRYTVADGWG